MRVDELLEAVKSLSEQEQLEFCRKILEWVSTNLADFSEEEKTAALTWAKHLTGEYLI